MKKRAVKKTKARARVVALGKKQTPVKKTAVRKTPLKPTGNGALAAAIDRESTLRGKLYTRVTDLTNRQARLEREVIQLGSLQQRLADLEQFTIKHYTQPEPQPQPQPPAKLEGIRVDVVMDVARWLDEVALTMGGATLHGGDPKLKAGLDELVQPQNMSVQMLIEQAARLREAVDA